MRSVILFWILMIIIRIQRLITQKSDKLKNVPLSLALLSTATSDSGIRGGLRLFLRLSTKGSSMGWGSVYPSGRHLDTTRTTSGLGACTNILFLVWEGFDGLISIHMLSLQHKYGLLFKSINFSSHFKGKAGCIYNSKTRSMLFIYS